MMADMQIVSACACGARTTVTPEEATIANVYGMRDQIIGVRITVRCSACGKKNTTVAPVA
jgi:hypothetical protein